MRYGRKDEGMIKGVNKRIVVMNCEKDSPFESAVFILRRGADDVRSDATAIDSDIVLAASRLIDEAESGTSLARPKRKKSKKRDRTV